MAVLTEEELYRICDGIRVDRDKIIKHNPIGTENETLLWMLMSVLVSYLSLDEKEIPCFPGDVDEATYRKATEMIIEMKRDTAFDHETIINRMLKS